MGTFVGLLVGVWRRRGLRIWPENTILRARRKSNSGKNSHKCANCAFRDTGWSISRQHSSLATVLRVTNAGLPSSWPWQLGTITRAVLAVLTPQERSVFGDRGTHEIWHDPPRPVFVLSSLGRSRDPPSPHFGALHRVRVGRRTATQQQDTYALASYTGGKKAKKKWGHMWCASCGLSDPIDRKCIVNASRLVATALEPVKHGACAQYTQRGIKSRMFYKHLLFFLNNPSLKREPNDTRLKAYPDSASC